MLNKEKRKFLAENINKVALDEIARQLHVRPDELKAEAKRLGLRSMKDEARKDTAGVPFGKTLGVIIIVLAVFAVYANTIPAQFVWDDQTIVVRNDAIKSFKHIPYVFSNQFAEMTKYRGNIYRPMQEISYMVDNFLWDMNPGGFHVTNILLQAAAAAALFWLILNISGSAAVAFIAALIFGIHPVNTEAVSYVAGRSDPLYLLFMIIAFNLYIKSAERSGFKAIAYCSLSLVLYLASVLSRETALFFPLLLLCYEKFAKRKGSSNLLRTIPFFVVAGCYLFFRLNIIPLDQKMLVFSKPETIILTNIRVLYEYIKILIFPFSLHMERVMIVPSRIDSSVVLSFIGILPLCLLFIYVWFKRRHLFFWVLWFIVFMLPHLNIMRLNALYAEHWIYAAAIGLYVLLAVFLERLIQNNRFRSTGYLCLAIIIIYLSSLTITRNFDWLDEPSFYANTSKYTRSGRLLSNFGVYYEIHGDYDKAIKCHEEAITISPNTPLYHNNIGLVYVKIGEVQKAIDHWKRSLELDPNQPKVREYIESYNQP